MSLRSTDPSRRFDAHDYYIRDDRTVHPAIEAAERDHEIELATHSAREYLWTKNGRKPHEVEFDDTLAIVGYN